MAGFGESFKKSFIPAFQESFKREEQRKATLKSAKEQLGVAQEFQDELIAKREGQGFTADFSTGKLRFLTPKQKATQEETAQFKRMGSVLDIALKEKKLAEPGASDSQTPVFDSLTPELKAQATSIVKDKLGTRAVSTEFGFLQNVEKVAAPMLAAGKSRDEIEDALRKSGQSVGFEGATRGALQQLSKGSERKFNLMEDFLGDIPVENKQERFDFIKTKALENMDAATAKKTLGQEITVNFFDIIKNDLRNLQRAGVDTNIFSGTAEQIKGKVGTVGNSELRKVATKIRLALINYRKEMTGVAFSEGESREYDAIFPSISKTAAFNSANIEALQETFNANIDFTYGHKIGKKNYSDLKNEISQSESGTGDFSIGQGDNAITQPGQTGQAATGGFDIDSFIDKIGG